MDVSGQVEPDPGAVPGAGRRGSPGRLLGGAALALLLATAVLLRPEQVLSTLQSPRALLVVASVVLLTLLLRRLTRGLPRPAAAAVTALPGLLAFLLLVVPLLLGTHVDEGLDGLDEVDTTGSTSAAKQVVTDSPPAEAPRRLTSADLQGIGHRASGTASLVRLDDGALLVRLEDLDVDPGPDYRLVLVPGAGQESPGEGGLDLGRLKATSGNQNYRAPQAAPDLPVTVLVWCRAFRVPIAAATLT